MRKEPSAMVDVTIRVDKTDAGRFDEIVRALKKQGLAETQAHTRFLIVNGAIPQSEIDALARVPGVASVRMDQRYGTQLG